ncbi:hypothetical protein [Gluconacetobacter entanii]|uniref:Uncharacterized protein n=1 Tax=Gluconacetobacter entanii TaxID=108528 RepID=A0A318PWK2_9PROT|nr:hypothetical protein [Gluconacetobacter entanii]PYD63548.1 hypothetical protein CFR72_06485 [Gluconacetobacter entanii]
MTQTITKEVQRTLDTVVTPERQRRSEWVTKGGVPRVRTTVQALLNAGDIDQGAADAAERWYRDFVFGHYGYVEFAPDHENDTCTRHDSVSWQVVRAKAVGRIADVRDALGMCAHHRLRLMLVEEKSFSAMGPALYPRLSPSVSRGRVSAQCALILEQLADFYEKVRTRRKEIT